MHPLYIPDVYKRQAFTNAQLGINHSIAHKIGAAYGLPHGLTNAILLPYVIRYNHKDPAAARHYANIARRVGLDGLTEKILSNSLIREIHKLNRCLLYTSNTESCDPVRILSYLLRPDRPPAHGCKGGYSILRFLLFLHAELANAPAPLLAGRKFTEKSKDRRFRLPFTVSSKTPY